MIKVTNWKKEFKKPIRGEGIIGMAKTLFSTKHEIKTDEYLVLKGLNRKAGGKKTGIFKKWTGILKQNIRK